MSMATPPIAPSFGQSIRRRILGNTRIVLLLTLVGLLVACLIFSWTTRDAMGNLSFLTRRSRGGNFGKKTIVDLRPWLTAQALAPLAVTAEEKEYARNAMRLADHAVDQAFASALRQATLQAQKLTPTGKALELAQKVVQLQDLIKQDQAEVNSITAQLNAPTKGSTPTVDNGDLEIAKAQLGLDNDQLADVQQDLDRESGDQSAQIHAELTAHEAAMQQYDKQVQEAGQVAVISERRHGTMASRVSAWFGQRDRFDLLQKAQQQTQADIATLTEQHNALEAKANKDVAAGTTDRASRLANIKDRAAQRQILGIYDDRIQTAQQLANIYGKWSAQVLVQHRILMHLILQSLALIIFIGICIVLADGVVHYFMDKPNLDRRRSQTLRSILELSIQLLGLILILFVVFGTPKETPTILGLTTAALTIALQDFIIAFLGWFVLIGKNGIHAGDWVEINGVGGEVTEVHLFTTTLLETGTLADKGLPTGRRITFMNGFAIRGQYFNFSTTGQWMWDELTVSPSPTADIHATVESIHKVVLEETEKNAKVAEQEWKRGTHGIDLSRFSATPVANLLPSGSGIDIQVRYITRASERFDLRNRLYQKILQLLRNPSPSAETQKASGG
jgi:small-conductance mechanosensitive channel